MKSLDTTTLELTIQTSIKVPKVFEIRNHGYKTLGASVIYSSASKDGVFGIPVGQTVSELNKNSQTIIKFQFTVCLALA